MKRKHLALVAPCLLIAGCAKGGGPDAGSTTNAPNRLTVTMQLQENVNPSFLYAFAFDDDSATESEAAAQNDGPQAIVTATTLANGIVAGGPNNDNEGVSVIVRVVQGRFEAFRRVRRSRTQEDLIPAVRAFVGTPRIAGRTIQFTLNLDAPLNNSTTANPQFLFLRGSDGVNVGATQLDTNFVTTTEFRNDVSNDNRIRPFDAFGARSATGGGGNRYQTFRIDSTQRFTDSGSVNEPAGDVPNTDGSVPDSNTRARLDIVDFTIDVVRSTLTP